MNSPEQGDVFIDEFLAMRGLLTAFRSRLEDLLHSGLSKRGIDVHSVSARVKSVSSLKDKLLRSEDRYSSLTDITDLPTFREVRDQYLPKQNKPASTTLSISKLARAGASLEVEAVAVLPLAKAKSTSKGKGARRTTKSARSKRR